MSNTRAFIAHIERENKPASAEQVERLRNLCKMCGLPEPKEGITEYEVSQAQQALHKRISASKHVQRAS